MDHYSDDLSPSIMVEQPPILVTSACQPCIASGVRINPTLFKVVMLTYTCFMRRSSELDDGRRDAIVTWGYRLLVLGSLALAATVMVMVATA